MPNKIVYTNDPTKVFQKPDPNNPVKYVYNPQLVGISSAPVNQPDSDNQNFSKLAQLLQSQNSLNKDKANLINNIPYNMPSHSVPSNGEYFTKDDIPSDKFLELNQEDLGPELTQKLSQVNPDNMSENQYSDFYKSIMEDPSLDEPSKESFQDWHQLYGKDDFQDPNESK